MLVVLVGPMMDGLDTFTQQTYHKEFLKYYSQVFDFVEIDSSFYNAHNLFMTK
jgi:uncharacterized protein YecE (DUF72 family)